MIKTYKDYEMNERELAQRYFNYYGITDYDFTAVSSKSPTDGIYTIDDTSTAFEVKVRNFSIDKYNDWILEYEKAKKLLEYDKQEYNTAYINFFSEPNGTYSVIEFDLSERFTKWRRSGVKSLITITQQRWLPSYTANGGGQKINKNVIMLRKKKCDKLTHLTSNKTSEKFW